MTPTSHKTKFIQLETSTPLHTKIIRIQALFLLQGHRLTIPNTCVKLLEIAADKLLETHKQPGHERKQA
jgi:hypothetical protein